MPSTSIQRPPRYCKHKATGRAESSVDTVNNGKDSKATQERVQVGSLVQWTSEGVEQFPEPQKVTGAAGEWAFVEGNETGILMSELSVAEPPQSQDPKLPPVNPDYNKPKQVKIEPPAEEGSVVVQYKLDEGTVRLEWPDELSKDSVEEFEYWVEGLIKRAKRKAGISNSPNEE